MPTLDQLSHVTTGLELAAWIVQFIGWCFALWALANALWRSFPAREFYYWLWRDPVKSAHLDRLRWEIDNGLHWSEEVARGQALFQGQPLSPQEIDARRREFDVLAKVSLGKRAVTYFLQCPLCQHFWTAALLITMTTQVGAADTLLSALACSSVISALSPTGTAVSSTSKRSRGCGGGCGSH